MLTARGYFPDSATAAPASCVGSDTWEREVQCARFGDTACMAAIVGITPQISQHYQ